MTAHHARLPFSTVALTSARLKYKAEPDFNVTTTETDSVVI